MAHGGRGRLVWCELSAPLHDDPAAVACGTFALNFLWPPLMRLQPADIFFRALQLLQRNRARPSRELALSRVVNARYSSLALASPARTRSRPPPWTPLTPLTLPVRLTPAHRSRRSTTSRDQPAMAAAGHAVGRWRALAGGSRYRGPVHPFPPGRARRRPLREARAARRASG